MPLGQGAQQGLRFLPGSDPGADGGGQRVRHVVARGAAVRPPEAHIEVGPVLAALLTVAPGAAAGPERLGEGAEDEVGGQRLEPAQEGRLGSGTWRNRCHRLRSSRAGPGSSNKNRAFGPVSGQAGRIKSGRSQLAGRRRLRHQGRASVPRTNVACEFLALRSTERLPARRRASSSRMKSRRRWYSRVSPR
jgi:hypothetical protein